MIALSADEMRREGSPPPRGINAMAGALRCTMLDIAQPFTFVETRKMKFAEWLDLADCPFQRNTEQHAKNAGHLKKYDDSHRRVTMAVLPDGRKFKVDGHTRTYLITRGLIAGTPSPLVMEVDVYRCVSIASDSLGALYRRFDSRHSVESAADETYSAVNEIGLEFKSAMLKASRYGGLLKRLYKLTNGYTGTSGDDAFTYRVVKYFSPELRLLDETAPLHKDMIGCVFMAAVLTFMRYGRDALPFWVKYNANQGDKQGNQVDGIQAVRNLLSDIRLKKHQAAAHDIENLGRIVNAYEMWRTGDFYRGKRGIPQPKDSSALDAFIARAVEKKGVA